MDIPVVSRRGAPAINTIENNFKVALKEEKIPKGTPFVPRVEKHGDDYFLVCVDKKNSRRLPGVKEHQIDGDGDNIKSIEVLIGFFSSYHCIVLEKPERRWRGMFLWILALLLLLWLLFNAYKVGIIAPILLGLMLAIITFKFFHAIDSD